jgi:ribosomal protein S18 acetylase RimI-like enzyme
MLWIDKLGVLAQHRGRGIGTTLIERHLARARRDGYEGVMLGVDTESLTGANKLYERIGFTPRYGGVRYILGDANFS